jgi:hypothetical protein
MFQINVVEGINTQILCSVTPFQKTVPFMRMWKNVVEPDRPQVVKVKVHPVSGHERPEGE